MKSQQKNAAVLGLPPWKTVSPGLQRIPIALLDRAGAPISGATVYATGDVACLPTRLQEEDSGRYSTTVEIPPDIDGMRRTIQLCARRDDHEAFGTLGFFIEDPAWVVRNDHVERHLLSWKEQFPDLLSLQKFVTFEGFPTYAVRLTNGDIDDDSKKKVLFVESHGHEPAGTAAIMEFLHQILTGSSQNGEPSSLPVERILDELLLVFVPIGNASGRERCPVQYWADQYDDHAVHCFIYGKLKGDPEPWTKSPSLLDRTEVNLDPTYSTPLRYEQIDDSMFVEPFFAMLPTVPGKLPFPWNRFPELLVAPEKEPGYRSALGYFVKILLDRYEFTTAVDLHQMTKPGDSAMVFARAEGRKGYNASSLQRTHEIASRIEADWLENGWQVGEEGRRRLTLDDQWPLNITDFIHLYGKGNPASFMVEVTKGPRTTKQMQKALTFSAITSIINHSLDPSTS
jgi:hypothetical protein